MLNFRSIKKIALNLLLFAQLVPATGIAKPNSYSSRDDSRLVHLNVLVLVRDGNSQYFLHGAHVQIQPLSSSGQRNFRFPRSAVTGNGGLARMGALPPSVLVGNYRVVVSHRDCGVIERRSYSLAQTSRPQSLSISFTGSCGF